ncbi:MAG: hypothetical protein KKC18_10315 [Chloroflexi bacterium]|nr:hypothetical protein [Chloroflexota bacterium]
MNLDPTTLALIDKIRGNGFAIQAHYDTVTFTATAKDAEGQTWTASGPGPEHVVRELAEQVGVDCTDA